MLEGVRLGEESEESWADGLESQIISEYNESKRMSQEPWGAARAKSRSPGNLYPSLDPSRSIVISWEKSQGVRFIPSSCNVVTVGFLELNTHLKELSVKNSKHHSVF